jgi:hypothetical protein
MFSKLRREYYQSEVGRSFKMRNHEISLMPVSNSFAQAGMSAAELGSYPTIEALGMSASGIRRESYQTMLIWPK